MHRYNLLLKDKNVIRNVFETSNICRDKAWKEQLHFAARRYTSAVAVYTVIVCPFVRLSVCLSQADTVPKRINVKSHKQRRTIGSIAHGLSKANDKSP